MMRDRFLFYRSFWDVLKQLPEENRLHFMDALCGYALDQEEPSFSDGMERIAWTAVKPNVDANWRSYVGGKTGGNGRPKR